MTSPNYSPQVNVSTPTTLPRTMLHTKDDAATSPAMFPTTGIKQELPSTATTFSNVEDVMIFRRLRWLQRQLGPKPNKHDLAVMLISACILEGLNRRGRIVGALRILGFKPAHIVMTLNHGTGLDPTQHRWDLDQEGRYRLHPQQESADHAALQ